MEVIYNDWAGQELVEAENVQLKTDHKAELPEGAKKVVGVTCQVYPQNTESKDSEVILTGNTVMRLIFINEFDKYDSKDIVEPFEKKIAVKDAASLHSIFSTVNILDSKWAIEDNFVNLSNIWQVVIKGVKEKNARLVADLAGAVEVKKLDHKVLTFNVVLKDKFDLEENIELDKNCEGILGVDANAFVKDVACADGKVAVKGVIAVNMIGVKTVDNATMPYNTPYEIDFAKTIAATGVSGEDLASGTVCVTAVNMHIENNNKGSVLVLQIALAFNGCSYVYKNFDTVVDAISFDKELAFETSNLERIEMLPQINTTVDIENNLNMPANMPYISRVLAVDGVKVNNLNVTAADGKAVIEGVLCANVLVENEEHLIANYLAEAPFQTSVRIDSVDSDYTVEATVAPLLLNVKARRGVELLLDAKLGLSVQATSKKTMTVVTAVIVGKDKTDDGSAIRIYIIGEKENLWDLAKRTNLGSAALIEQNPNLANGCTPGERIVVYRHEQVNL